MKTPKKTLKTEMNMKEPNLKMMSNVKRNCTLMCMRNKQVEDFKIWKMPADFGELPKSWAHVSLQKNPHKLGFPLGQRSAWSLKIKQINQKLKTNQNQYFLNYTKREITIYTWSSSLQRCCMSFRVWVLRDGEKQLWAQFWFVMSF